MSGSVSPLDQYFLGLGFTDAAQLVERLGTDARVGVGHSLGRILLELIGSFGFLSLLPALHHPAHHAASAAGLVVAAELRMRGHWHYRQRQEQAPGKN